MLIYHDRQAQLPTKPNGISKLRNGIDRIEQTQLVHDQNFTQAGEKLDRMIIEQGELALNLEEVKTELMQPIQEVAHLGKKVDGLGEEVADMKLKVDGLYEEFCNMKKISLAMRKDQKKQFNELKAMLAGGLHPDAEADDGDDIEPAITFPLLITLVDSSGSEWTADNEM